MSIINTIDSGAVMDTLNRISQFQAVVQKALKPGQDHDTIPGTNKPTLLKPGAEKITMMFGVNPEYEFIERTADYKAEFFSYDVRCTLFKNGAPVAQGVGSCNSKEKKYRYINVEEGDIPAHLDKNTVPFFTDKWGKKKYKIENPNICDLVNTILKMAKKRAFVDATLQLASLSDVFTQDLEDLRDYAQREEQQAAQSTTAADARNIKCNFGKYKGETLGQIFDADPDYIDWLAKNAKTPNIKAGAALLLKGDKKGETKKYAPNIDPATGELLEEVNGEFHGDDGNALDADYYASLNDPGY